MQQRPGIVGSAGAIHPPGPDGHHMVRQKGVIFRPRWSAAPLGGMQDELPMAFK
ncbi:hypothetical protein ANANG_G00094990 [Anguilla anguilla]|uniref:Uncharacterized protein n=1 Tax=Anguilla anguilla TaxID=7936 RepID=A0A9D3MFP2_ANGAN|nr:hypothetical protein ANANG_G00094990 [Anguilla anguilla]